MPGTVSGSVDHTITASPSGSNQEAFTQLFRFLNGPLRSGSYTELVALQYGLSPGAGAVVGSNFHDERNPFGENAFACFRWRSGSLPQGGPNSGPSTRRARDFYMLIQWSYNQTFGASPGSPGLCYGGSFGVGISVAYRDDGASPWNGTTNANGTDSKGNPVWISGSSVVHVLPRSNNAGGSQAIIKQNMVGYPQTVNIAERIHMLADRDSLLIMGDGGDNVSYNWMLYVGTYEPLSSSQFVTSSGGNMHMPMMMIGHSSQFPISITTTYGDTAGSATSQGGLVGPNTGSAEVRTLRTDRYGTNILNNNSLQPNPQFSPAAYDEFKIPVIMFESPAFGHVGYMDMITEAYNVPVHSTNSDNSKATFGTGGGAVNLVVPWSGSAPGSSTTRNGRQF